MVKDLAAWECRRNTGLEFRTEELQITDTKSARVKLRRSRPGRLGVHVSTTHEGSNGERRARNDPRQYDDLALSWWDPQGPLAMLHWIAKTRGALVPQATRDGAVLVDVGCGAGLLTPHVRDKRYHHIGVDLMTSALDQARLHGVIVVNGNALALPLEDEIADVVCAGEILEHLSDHQLAITEACRVLRPGGTLIIDTIASTLLARVVAVGIAERIPGGAPHGIHDPRLFVDRRALIASCADLGVHLRLNGLRPGLASAIGWRLGLVPEARMVGTRFTSVLFQGIGKKEERR